MQSPTIDTILYPGMRDNVVALLSDFKITISLSDQHSRSAFGLRNFVALKSASSTDRLFRPCIPPVVD